MFNNKLYPAFHFFFETDSLSFEEKREIKSLHLQTYNVFLITGFLQKRILKKKKMKWKRQRCCAGACGMFRVSVSWGTRRDPFSTYAWGQLFRFVTIKVLKRFELLDERFVLILQHGHSVFQTFNVLFLFPAALPCCLPVVEAHYYGQVIIEDTKLITPTKNTVKLRF